MTMLNIKDLESWYGKVQILHGVNMHVSKGEIVCIIGPNGAGKSTILKNIFGLIDKRKGNIHFEGKELIHKQPNEIVKEGISFVSQAAMESGIADTLGLQKKVEAVKNTRTVRKKDMIHNEYQPKIEVDSQTYEVRADGELLICEPADILPLAQRYYLF